MHENDINQNGAAVKEFFEIVNELIWNEWGSTMYGENTTTTFYWGRKRIFTVKWLTRGCTISTQWETEAVEDASLCNGTVKIEEDVFESLPSADWEEIMQKFSIRVQHKDINDKRTLDGWCRKYYGDDFELSSI